jgi:predicted dehydrogenase
MRVLQVGMGGWGRNWTERIVPQVPAVELVGFVDTNPATLLAAEEQGLATAKDCYSSMAEAIETTRPEAALITAALSGHVPIARQALEAGLHVLVEKPFAPSVREGAELVELADQAHLTLMVSQNYRFRPAVRAVQDIVRSGSLGPLHTVSIDFRKFSPVGPNGRSPHHALEEPLLVDMSIHHFDLLRAVLGRQPLEVFCRTWNPAWSWFDGPAEGAAIMTFDEGLTVSYRGSWISPGPLTPWSGEWRLEFEHGELWWTSQGPSADTPEDEDVIIRPLGQDEQRVELQPMELVDRAGSLAEFAAAAGSGRIPESSGAENLGSLELMYAAVESAATRKLVAIR